LCALEVVASGIDDIIVQTKTFLDHYQIICIKIVKALVMAGFISTVLVSPAEEVVKVKMLELDDEDI
jgi:hypothetical protein